MISESNKFIEIVFLCLISFYNMYSWELALTLKESKARFESAGVKLIAIGIGEPKKAQILAERVLISILYLSLGRLIHLVDKTIMQTKQVGDIIH